MGVSILTPKGIIRIIDTKIKGIKARCSIEIVVSEKIIEVATII